jgi:flagellar motor switch protein FliM
MNQVLSQAEVDALLTAVADGSVDTGGASGSGKAGNGNTNVQNYDLTNQDRVIRGKMPTLDLIYERFVRLFRISLSNSLRKIASISIISTDLLKFGEFVNTLPIPSCVGILRSGTLRGPVLLVFESKLSYALIDSYFGGTDRPYTKVDGKEFTRIELMIMNKVLQLGIADLEEAWAPVHRMSLEHMRTEVNPQFVGVVPLSEVIISTTFEVELENASGTIALVIPYSTIESIKNKLNTSFQADGDRADRVWVENLEDHMKNLDATVSVNLGETQINVGDLVNLNVGDVLPLNQDCDGELKLLVEGVPKFKCFFGVTRGTRAVQITQSLEE